jgi:hypothetical protein
MPSHQPMILGVMTALGFLFVAGITIQSSSVFPPDGERVAYRR